MKKIKVGVQVPAGGRPMRPGFLFSSGITTPYLKAWLIPPAKILNYRGGDYQDYRMCLGKFVPSVSLLISIWKTAHRGHSTENCHHYLETKVAVRYILSFSPRQGKKWILKGIIFLILCSHASPRNNPTLSALVAPEPTSPSVRTCSPLEWEVALSGFTHFSWPSK